MSDKLVFDLANEVDDAPNVFVRKDWVNFQDNQNGNYNSNQSVIDTSQISNSNKWVNYREGYLAIPLTMVLTNGSINAATNGSFAPASSIKSCDFALGLKNWFGTIIHSMTVDYNGSTAIQQTPFINMWNSFKLMTTLSWQDVASAGSVMGFYPDEADTFTFQTTESSAGRGVCNNTNMRPPVNVLGVRLGKYIDGDQTVLTSSKNVANSYKSGLGNEGFLRRQCYVNYDPAGSVGQGVTAFSDLFSVNSCTSMYKSYISVKQSGVNNGASGVYVNSIMAFVHLKHIHSFFNNIPLIKGAFFKITLNLNNCSTSFSIAADNEASVAAVAAGAMTVTAVQNNIGGVNPLMIASREITKIGVSSTTGGIARTDYYNGGYPLGSTAGAVTYIASISVGKTCLNSTQVQVGGNATSGNLANSIQMYVPTYSFNSVFEQAYISSPIKKIVYEDLYQYQINNIDAGTGQINNLVTNGIANMKSVLILPFYSVSEATNLALAGVPVYQSPYDPAGTGPTSPLALLTNFNVVVSGQNMIYNTERYGFEQFIQQTYGCNSINGGMTDGLTSGLIDMKSWELGYCYYYVDVGRMLPVEKSVPKSVQIIGQNACGKKLDLMVFISHEAEVSFDCLSGAKL